MILFAWVLIISPCSLRHRPMRNTSGLLPLTASSPLQRTTTNASPSSWLHPGPCETVGLFILATPAITQSGSQVFDLLVELLSLQIDVEHRYNLNRAHLWARMQSTGFTGANSSFRTNQHVCPRNLLSTFGPINLSPEDSKDIGTRKGRYGRLIMPAREPHPDVD